MDAFLFLSAYFLGKKDSFPKNKIIIYSCCYLFWNIFVFFIASIREAIKGTEGYSLFDFFDRILCWQSESFPWDYPLWFLLYLIIFFLMTPLLSYCRSKIPPSFLVLVFVILSIIFFSFNIPPFEGTTILPKLAFNFIYFAMGYFLAPISLVKINDFFIKYGKFLIIVYILIYIILRNQFYIQPFFLAIIGILGTLTLSHTICRLVPKLDDFWRNFSATFFFVYVTHIIVIETASYFLSENKLLGNIFYFIFPLLYLFLASLLYKFLRIRYPKITFALFLQH
ncbi:MAG: acyltransferase family protein [Akkermansia sp.]